MLFHTAAFFRDSYKGGRHWDELFRVNVTGTEALLEAAYEMGVRRMVHTSSGGVLDGPPGSLIDETMARAEADANDYFRSKILCDRAIRAFLDSHPDFDATFVLPGFMFGPGDAGPTASGQLVLDFARRRAARAGAGHVCGGRCPRRGGVFGEGGGKRTPRRELPVRRASYVDGRRGRGP